MNTEASEQTEPEELKENKGGRDRGAGVGEGGIHKKEKCQLFLSLISKVLVLMAKKQKF